MKALNVVMTAVWIAFLTGVSMAGIKYIAIVEGDIDEGSGASEKISRADVRLVTAEIRREAVKNLPPKRYVIMTSETVIAQGGAVLEECAEENCVISLGSRIGADYIIRGTVSQLESRFTLQVEMYETNDGTLVASCDPVRSESISTLVEMAAAACANMFKAWLATQDAPETTAAKEEYSKISWGSMMSYANNFGGGVKWPSGGAVAMPTTGIGTDIFFNTAYLECMIGFGVAFGKWESASAPDEEYMPNMSYMYYSGGVFGKYPMRAWRFTFFPLLGIEYEGVFIGGLAYKDISGKEGNSSFQGDASGIFGEDGYPPADWLSAIWVKIGGGVDFRISKRTYLRGELLYGVRAPNTFEKKSGIDGGGYESGKAMSASGINVRIGVGSNFKKPDW